MLEGQALCEVRPGPLDNYFFRAPLLHTGFDIQIVEGPGPC